MASNGYQTTMFSQLDEDVELEDYVVMIDDCRWTSCVEELRTAKWICIDTEFCSHLGPWKRKDIDYWTSLVRLIQVGLPSGLAMVFSLGGLLDNRPQHLQRHASALDVLKRVVEDHTVPKAGMYLVAEYMLLRIHFGWKMRCMRDVMLMSQVYWAGAGAKPKRYTETGPVHTPMLKHNLASICERLGIAVDKTEQLSDWAGPLQRKQLNYAARDVIVPRLAWVELTKRAQAEGLMKSFEAECSAQPAFCEVMFNGLPIDLDVARADLATWEKVRDGFAKPFLDLFPGVSINAPAQVAEVLSKALDSYQCSSCKAEYDPMLVEPKGTPLPSGWQCCAQSKPERTYTRKFFEQKMIRGKMQDSPTTSDEVLSRFDDVWYVKALLEARSTSTCMNWLKAAIENAFDTGTGTRIRAEFKQIAGGGEGADDGTGRGMGRSSASKPLNTQNPSNLQPAHEKAGAVSVRRCIRPKKGRAFIVADLSQAHGRIAAQWSRDPVMLKAFNEGIDFHLVMTHRLMVIDGMQITFEEAVQIAEDKTHPLHKDLKSRRTGTKSTNYAKLNLSGVQTLKTQMATMPVPIRMSDEEVAKLIKVWNDLYRVLYYAQKRHLKIVNSHSHKFHEIGVDGEYGEARGLTGRRLYLVKEWKQPRERDDGSMSAGYWSVKATDAVSFIWMGTEGDLIKRAAGKLVPIFDAHPEWDVIFSNMAHDEWDFDCDEKYALDVATVVQREFDDAMRWAGVVDLPVNEKDAHPSKLIKPDWSAK